MQSSETVWILISIIATLFLFFFGYMGLFRTKTVIDFYLRSAERNYLKSLEQGFFTNKYYQAFMKYQYELLKQRSEKKWFFYNMKICSGVALFMAVLFLVAIIHTVFKVNFGIFISN
jgi:hypothetical protein